MLQSHLTIYDTAVLAHSQGIPALPIRHDGTKAPDVRSWRKYTGALPDEALIDAWFDARPHEGIALVTGEFSGIEALDFDDPAIYEEFKQRAVEWGLGDVLERMESGYCELTPRQGHHLLYRPQTVGRNTVLAKKPTDNPLKPKTLIETRGEGGYIVVAPSTGACHRVGEPWVLLRGGIEHIAKVADRERDALFEVARSFHTYQRPVKVRRVVSQVESKGRPGDAYNRDAVWDELLTEHGWTRVRDDGVECYWAHPGKTGSGHGATTNFNGSDRLFVFTTNSIFEAGRSYSKFEAYAVLAHDGDFSAAAQTLARQGYGSLPTFERTELGNADRFVEANLDDIRYCHEFSQWLVWDGTHWQLDQNRTLVFQRFRAMLDEMLREAEGLQGDARQPALNWAKASRSRRQVDAALNLAQRDSRIAIRRRDFDADDMVFNVENGTVDLSGGMLQPHERADLLRRLATVKFRPDARDSSWEALIAHVTQGDIEYAHYLQKTAGLALIGRNVFERVFILFGPGRTGKSTFLEGLKAVLGEYATAAEPDTFASRMKGRISNDIARVLEYRTVLVSELGEEDQLAMSLIKQLTGGDTISARLLYHEAEEGVGKLNVFMAVNQFPKVNTLDSGARRRIVSLPFLNVVTEGERDRFLKQYFTTNSGAQEAILAWAVEGCVMAIEEGLDPVPDVVAQAIELFWQEANPLTPFIAEACVLGDEEEMGVSELWDRYEVWCDRTRCRRVERAKFKEYLKDFGVEEKRSKRARRYVGISSDRAWEVRDAA